MANSKKKTTITKPVVKSFNCPSCGAVLEITAVGMTLSVSCKSCGSILDASDPNFKLLKKYKRVRRQFYIPLGTRGKIGGTTYECIGIMERRDGAYAWREYLLYNPYKRYRWLFEIDGHWSLFKRVYKLPKKDSSEQYIWNDHKFKLFNRGNAKVEYVEGEFYWRVGIGETTRMVDYIAPPYMLSKETNKEEEIWTVGKYMNSSQVQNVFKIKEPSEGSWEVGANEPSPIMGKGNIKYALFSFLFLIFVSVLGRSLSQGEVVFEKSISIIKNQKVLNSETGRYEDTVHKSEPFDIGQKGISNVELMVGANLYNSWLFVDALLVNQETGKGIPMPVEVSYYAGSGWSEGSRSAKKMVFNIPAGRYYFSIKSKNGGRSNFRSYRLRLTRGVFVWSNLIIFTMALFIMPFLTFWRRRNFEMRRWSNSDHSPYSSD
jgi:hypothetical protein